MNKIFKRYLSLVLIIASITLICILIGTVLLYLNTLKIINLNSTNAIGISINKNLVYNYEDKLILYADKTRTVVNDVYELPGKLVSYRSFNKQFNDTTTLYSAIICEINNNGYLLQLYKASFDLVGGYIKAFEMPVDYSKIVYPTGITWAEQIICQSKDQKKLLFVNFVEQSTKILDLRKPAIVEDSCDDELICFDGSLYWLDVKSGKINHESKLGGDLERSFFSGQQDTAMLPFFPDSIINFYNGNKYFLINTDNKTILWDKDVSDMRQGFALPRIFLYKDGIFRIVEIPHTNKAEFNQLSTDTNTFPLVTNIDTFQSNVNVFCEKDDIRSRIVVFYKNKPYDEVFVSRKSEWISENIMSGSIVGGTLYLFTPKGTFKTALP